MGIIIGTSGCSLMILFTAESIIKMWTTFWFFVFVSSDCEVLFHSSLTSRHLYVIVKVISLHKRINLHDCKLISFYHIQLKPMRKFGIIGWNRNGGWKPVTTGLMLVSLWIPKNAFNTDNSVIKSVAGTGGISLITEWRRCLPSVEWKVMVRPCLKWGGWLLLTSWWPSGSINRRKLES